MLKLQLSLKQIYTSLLDTFSCWLTYLSFSLSNKYLLSPFFRNFRVYRGRHKISKVWQYNRCYNAAIKYSGVYKECLSGQSGRHVSRFVTKMCHKIMWLIFEMMVISKWFCMWMWEIPYWYPLEVNSRSLEIILKCIGIRRIFFFLKKFRQVITESAFHLSDKFPISCKECLGKVRLIVIFAIMPVKVKSK